MRRMLMIREEDEDEEDVDDKEEDEDEEDVDDKEEEEDEEDVDDKEEDDFLCFPGMNNLLNLSHSSIHPCCIQVTSVIVHDESM